ncbi:uncharacterized protein LOC127096766 [Lathyrus oleraceus]|uniref:uncharacterized protein LOC127096766 n=1 Tax=Pisum sativum TaxID=3888 RepID=UPI0021D2330E|nr:uncharacterized protein LOC127096766 [Pisum sativum]
MSSYAKFLKEILTNKNNLDEDGTMTLIEECIAIIQNKIPSKLKDPRSFSIPYVIGKYIIDKALCKLGSIVSLTPLSILMDIKKDNHIPILLGRPFLATTGAIIDVKIGKLTFEVAEEKIEFILSQLMKTPSIDDTCFFADIIDECIKKLKSEAPPTEELNAPPT